ncbi:MAG: NADP-dependent 3-hydroxy acid dehydrogenase YdfG [Glaciecola sp.]|jgi:NADP-dependent 3-hydroxy acid dehydrogenase YdfG
MTTVVITGGTRGIGRGLAHEFLTRNCNVVITGRSQDTVDQVVRELGAAHSPDRVLGVVCDVRDLKANQNLWDRAAQRFGKLDVWLMNAGVTASRVPLWELDSTEIHSVVDTNVLGSLLGAKVAMTGMLEQGSGRLYVMEGFGSNGMAREGMVTYGASKRAVRYIRKALRKDLGKDAAVGVGTISPGMVLTDMLLGEYDHDSAEWDKTKKIFNILADKVETVTPWLAQQVLADQVGGKIEWLTAGKVARRFAMARVSKRDLFTDA